MIMTRAARSRALVDELDGETSRETDIGDARGDCSHPIADAHHGFGWTDVPQDIHYMVHGRIDRFHLHRTSRSTIGQPCKTWAWTGVDAETDALDLFTRAHAIENRADDRIDFLDRATYSSFVLGSPDLGVRADPIVDPAGNGMRGVNLNMLDTRIAQSVEEPVGQAEILGTDRDLWHARPVLRLPFNRCYR